MASKEYTLIQEEIDVDEICTHHHKDVSFSKRRHFVNGIVSITLAVSLAANALSIILHLLPGPHENCSNRTAFGRVTLALRIV